MNRGRQPWADAGRRGSVLLLTAVLGLLNPVPVVPAETADAAGKPAPGYGATPRELQPYNRSHQPDRTFYTEPLVYNGRGRLLPTPANLESIAIGLIVPQGDMVESRNGLALRRGVELAFREANDAGGYAGLPFRLVLRPDQQLWGSSSNTVIDLAYGEKVWAILGSIDANSTHVALRVALKAEVPMINVGSGDPTMTETGIPWIARITPDDRQTGYVMARLLFQDMNLSRVAVVRSNDRYGRFGIREFRDAARRLGRPLPMEIQFPPGEQDFTSVLERLEAADPQAVVLWSRAPEASRALKQLRQGRLEVPVVGTDRLASRQFLELAGASAEGVMATSWLHPNHDTPGWTAFSNLWRQRHHENPEAFAVYGYDAARLLIAAIHEAGLNRARIRDVVMSRRQYTGMAGTIHLSPTANSITPPHLVQVQGGQFAAR